MKKVITGSLVVVILITAIVLYINYKTSVVSTSENNTTTGQYLYPTGDNTKPFNDFESTTTLAIEPVDYGYQNVIGKSAGGQDIIAYQFGSGEKELLFVSGVHGIYGDESNTLNNVMDYLKANPSEIPSNLRINFIPVLNVDGFRDGSQIEKRLNSNKVDINRNFDCNWQSNARWQNKTVSGGTSAFSEPESQAIRDFVLSHSIRGVIIWYSKGGGVYASKCVGDVSPKTLGLVDAYAQASGYTPYKSFDSYEVTGDMADWLASWSIPAISVLITDYDNPETDRNVAGVKAALKYFSENTGEFNN